MKPKRKIKKLRVNFISLVDRPATGLPLVLKEFGGYGRVFDIVKSNEEMRRAYGVVYPVGKVDSQGDVIEDAKVIRDAQLEFSKACHVGNVDKNHSYQKTGALVVESWLIRKGDTLFPNETPGGWAVGIQVDDDALWEQVKTGKLTGISLAGDAEVAEVKAEEKSTDLLQQFLDKVKPLLSKQTVTESEVTPEDLTQLKTAFAEAVKPLVEGLSRVEQQLGKSDEAGKTNSDTSKSQDTELPTLENLEQQIAALKANNTATKTDAETTQLDEQTLAAIDKVIGNRLTDLMQKGSGESGVGSQQKTSTNDEDEAESVEGYM